MKTDIGRANCEVILISPHDTCFTPNQVTAIQHSSSIDVLSFFYEVADIRPDLQESNQGLLDINIV